MLASAGGTLAAGPTAYLTETISAYYNYNGTLAVPVSRTGYVEVLVPNTLDVLQYLRGTLSGTTNTNLQSVTVYKDSAASPISGDRTRIYLFTTGSSKDISYSITNSAIGPVFATTLSYRNIGGGSDLFDGMNTLGFNLTLTSTAAASGVSLFFRTARDTSGSTDSVDLYDVSATSGSVQSVDTDGDSIRDEILWSGNINPGIPVRISFMGRTQPGINFDSALMFLDMDGGTETYTQLSQPSTFTGIYFVDWFSRGPIREGAEIMKSTNWVARGFIRNMAQGLDYIVHGWSLYEIGVSPPRITSSNEFTLLPDQTAYTDWYNTGNPVLKGYYSSAFDWEVLWEANSYSGTSRTVTYLPTLYVMDSWADKAAVLQSNAAEGTLIHVTDSVRHLGHSSLEVGNVEIDSSVPTLSLEGYPRTWTKSNIKVYFYNGVTMQEITGFSTIVTGSGNVYVNVTNMTAAIGRNLRQNEDIIVSYDISSGPSQNNEMYSFCTNTTMRTLSGTPDRSGDCTTITIPGVAVTTPGGGEPSGGGGMTRPSPRAEIVKDSVQTTFKGINSVKVESVAKVIDSGDKGIQDMKALVYVPSEAVVDMNTFTVSVFDSSRGMTTVLRDGVDITIRHRGIVDFRGKKYSEYLLEKKSDSDLYDTGIDLYNNDKLTVSYETTTPYGTWMFVTRVSGYNYYEDKIVIEDIEIPVRRELDEKVLSVKQSGWVQGEALVGKPVPWTRTVDVSNPGRVPIEYKIVSDVFYDTLSAYVTDGSYRERLDISKDEFIGVSWTVKVRPGETRRYVLVANTPPVLEIGRNLSSNELNDADVEFFFTSVIRNFAEESYENVTFSFPIAREKIKSVKSDKGPVSFREDAKGITVDIPSMQQNETMTIYIDFISRLPVLITRPSAIQYECSDLAIVNVTLIPSENDTLIYLETDLAGPEPDLTSRYVNLRNLYSIEPFKNVEESFVMDISSLPDGKYIFKATLKKDFIPLTSDDVEIYVHCPARNLLLNAETVLLIAVCAAVAAVAYIIIRNRRKRGFSRDVQDLKEKLKAFGI
jgi:hypothetical protein